MVENSFISVLSYYGAFAFFYTWVYVYAIRVSIVYISALCAVAGISFDLPRHDDDSTDAIIKKLITLKDGRKCESILRIQLKSTSAVSQYREMDDSIVYSLKVKNYNDLRRMSTTPIILAVLILPEDSSEWLRWTEEELMIKGRMYWMSLVSAPEIDNVSSVSVHLPKQNCVNSDTLLELLEKIAEEA